jgi:peptidoglycan/xylan/chitin deacetylase (PgdA/CDA1 family)
MILKIWLIVKQGLIRLIAELMDRTGLMPIALSVCDRWALEEANGLIPFISVKRKKGFHYQVLLYHRVNDEKDPILGAVPVKVFRKQMEVLSKYFQVLPLEDLVERALRRQIPPKAVAITFDDGYRDNYEYAFPILRELSLPATIFLTTGCIDSDDMLWYDRMRIALLKTKLKSLRWEGHYYSLDSIDNRRAAFYNLREVFLLMAEFQKREKLEDLLGILGVNNSGSEKQLMLEWHQIREMASYKIDFGAHTVTHPLITKLPISYAQEEVYQSKAKIEDMVGCPVRLWAYPNARLDDLNSPIQQVLQKAGFIGAFPGIWGTNCADTNPFELRRQAFFGSVAAECALRLTWYRFTS